MTGGSTQDDMAPRKKLDWKTRQTEADRADIGQDSA